MSDEVVVVVDDVDEDVADGESDVIVCVVDVVDYCVSSIIIDTLLPKFVNVSSWGA